MPSRRTTLRWLCTVLAVVIGAAWIESMWFGVTRTWRSIGHTRTVALFAGTFCLIDAPGGEPAVSTDTWVLHGPKTFWWFQWWVRSQQSSLVIPLWVPFAASLGAGGWLWTTEMRRRRRVRVGCCPCGYDRAGLAPGAPCPECGAPGHEVEPAQ